MPGTERDPLAALIMCGPFSGTPSFINGQQIIEKGALLLRDIDRALADHRETMRRIAEK